jgi:hypothetical protein
VERSRADQYDVSGRWRQISEAMGLSDIRNRQWSIKETTATQGSGLFEGFDWYAAAIGHFLIHSY